MSVSFRKPARPPRPEDIVDRDRWEALVSTSLATTQGAAEKWRTGLAAFVTLVTGGLFIKGPEAAQDLTTMWRLVLTVSGGAGLLLAVTGLWLALRAAAGAPSSLSYAAVHKDYGGVRQLGVASARRAANILRWAKLVVGASLVALGATAFAWWWAPEAPPSPPAYLQVELDGVKLCGTLLSADDQEARLDVDGRADPVSAAFGDIKNLAVVTDC